MSFLTNIEASLTPSHLILFDVLVSICFRRFENTLRSASRDQSNKTFWAVNDAWPQ